MGGAWVTGRGLQVAAGLDSTESLLQGFYMAPRLLRPSFSQTSSEIPSSANIPQPRTHFLSSSVPFPSRPLACLNGNQPL